MVDWETGGRGLRPRGGGAGEHLQQENQQGHQQQQNQYGQYLLKVIDEVERTGKANLE